jgi:hypothetical protein
VVAQKPNAERLPIRRRHAAARYSAASLLRRLSASLVSF